MRWHIQEATCILEKASTPFAKWVSNYAELAAGEVFELDSKINAVENQKKIVTRVGSLCLIDYEN